MFSSNQKAVRRKNFRVKVKNGLEEGFFLYQKRNRAYKALAKKETKMSKIKIEYFGESKDQKIWSVWGDAFGEVNSYLLDYNTAIKMAEEESLEGNFDDLIVYCPATAKARESAESLTVSLARTKSKGNKNVLAQFIEQDRLLIVKGPNVIGTILSASEYDYDVNIYRADAVWDDNEEAYPESSLLDGGICEDGSSLDAIEFLISMIKDEEDKAIRKIIGEK